MEEQIVETNEQQVVDADVVEQTELSKLKVIADELGIKYAHKIGVDALRARIAEHVDQTTTTTTTNDKNELFEGKTLRDNNFKGVIYKPNENVFCTITCNDPNMASRPSIVLCVGNYKTYIRKCIPFGVKWAVPQALLDVIIDKKYSKYTTTKNDKGHEITKVTQEPAFNIKYEPKPTKEEIEAIRQNQLMNKEE